MWPPTFQFTCSFAAKKEVSLTLLASQAAATLPHVSSSFFIAGCLYHLKHDLQPAVHYYTRVLTLHPQHELAWSLMGQLSMETAQTAQALKAFRRAAAINPRSSTHFYHIGLVYELMAAPSSSVFYYQKAVELR